MDTDDINPSFPEIAIPRHEPDYDEYVKERALPASERIIRLEWEKELEERKFIRLLPIRITIILLVLLISSGLLIYLLQQYNNQIIDVIALPQAVSVISVTGSLGLLWFIYLLVIAAVYYGGYYAKIARLDEAIDGEQRVLYDKHIYLEHKIQALDLRRHQAVIGLIIIAMGLVIFETFEIYSFRRLVNHSVSEIILMEVNTSLILPPILWLVTIVIASAGYYFWYQFPLDRARRELATLHDFERRKLMREPNKRWGILQEEVRNMTAIIASVFLDNQERFILANSWREQADSILEKWMVNDSTSDLGEAETLIGQINELILREKNELQQQRRWRVVAIVIMLVYILIPVAVILRFPEAATTELVIPVFGIPLSVVMWGAMGSLAAILYRFYTERNRVRLDLEVRWLIARPIIGVIMGGLAYLAIVSGMAILNMGSVTVPSVSGGEVLPQNLEAFWVIAFLAGFSDKFYLGFVKLLVGRALGEPDKNLDQAVGKAENS